MPYPKNGDWVPCENIKLGAEYPEHAPEPDLDATNDAIQAIRFHRENTIPEYQQEMKDLAKDPKTPDKQYGKLVRDWTNRVGDDLDDMLPAFGKEPGKHSGSTEFMN